MIYRSTTAAQSQRNNATNGHVADRPRISARRWLAARQQISERRETSNTNGTLSELQTYSALGWRVVPLHSPTAGGCSCKSGANCPSIGKHPRISEWQKQATSDIATINTWWSQWPDANIGIALGEASGLVDFEFDSEEGHQTLLALFGGALPACPCFRSSRGQHNLFRWRTDLPNQATLPVQGLDLKIGNGGRGSQCVFPPSQHASGTHYKWVVHPDDVDLPAIPDEVIARIVKLRREARQTTKVTAQVRRAPICNGQRNNELFRLACRHASDPGLAEIVANANRRCEVPLDEAEVAAIVSSASRYAEAVPNIRTPQGRTDLANAQRLATEYDDTIRWVDPWNKWLIWDGTRWAIDNARQIEQLAKRMVRGLWSELATLAPDADDASAKAMASFVKSSNNAAAIRNLVQLARSEPGIAIHPTSLDRDPWQLNVLNGTVDLKTGELLAHDRDNYHTKVAPVAFDVDAKCPLWIAFLRTILSDDKTLYRYVQRLVGYSISGQSTEHILAFLHGVGANGKSTFVNTLLSLLGNDYAMKAPTELILAKRNDAHPTEKADLFGKRFVACVEADGGRRLAESLIKEMTGGDAIRARRLYEDFWQFSPSHTIWLAANHKPIIRGTDHGMWRRVKLIPFEVVIPDDEQDRDLTEKLRAELPGILNWALRGCLDWQAQGLGEPEKVREATSEYRAESDVIGKFLAHSCNLVSDAECAGGLIFKAYKDWCQDNGENVVNQTVFGHALTERGIGKRHGKLGSIRIGVELRCHHR